MRSKTETGVVALTLGGAFALALLFVRGGSTTDTPHEPTLDEKGNQRPSGERADQQALLEEPEKWRKHLADGGVVRLLAPGAHPDSATEVVGLGKLTGEDLAFARTSIQRTVDKRNRELIREYESQQVGDRSVEENSLREAHAQVESATYEAFLRGFEKGEYFLVKSAKEAPPLPASCLALNVGVMHKGEAALCVIMIRKSDYGVDAVEEHARAMQRAYMQKIAAEFNGKSDEERAGMIQRLDRNAPEDSEWRRKTFPPGTRIDRVRNLLVF